MKKQAIYGLFFYLEESDVLNPRPGRTWGETEKDEAKALSRRTPVARIATGRLFIFCRTAKNEKNSRRLRHSTRNKWINNEL